MGDVNLADRDYIVGRGLAALQTKHGDELFLFYALLYNKERIAALGSGTTFQSINRSTLFAFEIGLPPLPEQRAIARVLRAVQDAREARRRELELERERKALLRARLLGGETNGEPRVPTEYGELPRSWSIRPLSELSLRVVDCPHTTPCFVPSGVVVVRNFNVRDGQLVLAPAFFTSETEYRERIARCEPGEGDVLFSREAPVGEACAIPACTRLSLGQRMMLIRPDATRLSGAYLVHALYAPAVRARMASLSTGVTAKHLNVADVRRLAIPVPPLREQHEIAGLLGACHEKVRALEVEATLLGELFRAVLEELMTGRVSAAALVEKTPA